MSESRVVPTPSTEHDGTIQPRPAQGVGWIVSPLYDLCFIANVGWLLLLLPGFSSNSDTPIDFWQIYFLTLPHRWITLFLVILDPDRREGRGRLLIIIALAFLGFVGLVRQISGAFLCLAVIDYLWNAWHFAAQHAGVLRIYSKKVGGGSESLERYGIRFFVTYAAIRSAGWATGRLEADTISMNTLRTVDLLVLVAPAILVLVTLTSFQPRRLGKTIYIVSVCSLYSALIYCLSYRQTGGVIALTTASGLFHAVEYLAIVTYYAKRRVSVGSDGAFRVMARSWIIYLGIYLSLLGSLGVWLDQNRGPVFEAWQGINLWMAFTHYAFDGMIWKLRRPDTSLALGAQAMIAPKA